MIANIYRLEGGERVRFEDDPRFIARKTEQLLADKGIADEIFLGPEFEFYVLDNAAFKNDVNHMEVYLDSSQADWNSGLKEGGSGLTIPPQVAVTTLITPLTAATVCGTKSRPTETGLTRCLQRPARLNFCACLT
jgi:glutamine synthetase